MGLITGITSERYEFINEPIPDLIGYTKAEGGGTFNAALQPIRFDEGFLVGITGRDIDIDSFNESYVQAFLNQGGLAVPGNLLGTWVHEGRVYIDITTHVGTFPQAQALAAHYGQFAVYDCARGVSVNTASGVDLP